jgi:hypothetical protein
MSRCLIPLLVFVATVLYGFEGAQCLDGLLDGAAEASNDGDDAGSSDDEGAEEATLVPACLLEVPRRPCGSSHRRDDSFVARDHTNQLLRPPTSV